MIVIPVAIVAFLLGAGWQYLRVNRLTAELEVAERAAAFNALEAKLGAATMEALRGSYEIARQHTSDFFTGLQADIGRATEQSRAPLLEILGQRDAMITALSRSNPRAAPMLADLFTRYGLAIGRPVAPDATEPTVPVAPADSPADTTLTTTTTTTAS